MSGNTRPPIRTTHTFVILELSGAAYDEIAGKLRAAGYGQVFNESREYSEPVIDMFGIAVAREGDPPHA